MSDERIGGISVGLSGELAQLEADLREGERMVAESAKRMSGNFPLSASVNVGGRGGGVGAGGGGEIVTAINALTQQLQQTRFTGGGRGGRQADPYALSLRGGSGGRANIDLGDFGQRAQEQIRKALGEAMASDEAQFEVRVDPQPLREIRQQAQSTREAVEQPVAVHLDFKDALDGIKDLVAAVAELRSSLSQPMTVAAPAGSAGSSRRARRPQPDDQGVYYRAMPGPDPDDVRAQQRSVSSAREQAALDRSNERFAKAIAKQLDADTPAPSGRRPMQIVREPVAAMSPFQAMEPAGLSRQRSAAMLRGETRAERLRRLRMEAWNQQTAWDAILPPQPETPWSATIAPQRTTPMTDAERMGERRPRLNTRMASESERLAMPALTGRPTRTLSAIDSDVFSPEQLRRLVGAQGAYSIRAAQIQRSEEAQRIAREADVLTQGRTSRTGASSLAGFVLGGRRGEVAAQAAFGVSERELKSAEAYKKTLDEVINREDFRLRSKGQSADADAWTRDARRSKEYQSAVDQVTKAEQGRAAALKDVQKYTEGALPAARNLFAITVGGAAFGAGLQAVDFVLKAAAPAAENWVDIQSGFALTSQRVTTELAKQTAQLQGNAKAAVLSAEATAGISKAAADAINPQLTLTTQIKAGAAAMSQSSDLFRAAYGAGGAPSGQYGGYGGLFGGALFAQQMGGGMGVTERAAQDWSAMSGQSNMLGQIGSNAGSAMNYLMSPAYRKVVDSTSGAAGGTALRTGLQGIPFIGPALASGLQLQDALQQPATGKASSTQTAYMNDMNAAIDRGNKVLGQAANAHYAYTTSLDKQQAAAAAAAAAGDVYGAQMAEQGLVLEDNSNAVISNKNAYQQATQALAVGKGMPDLATVTAQSQQTSVYQEQLREAQSKGSLEAIGMAQQFALPGQIASIQRQYEQQTAFQQPAQAALGYYAAPPTLPGVGLPTTGASDQKLVQQTVEATARAQEQLNTYYQGGLAILRDTYGVSQSLLDSLTSTGSQIQGLQTDISSRDAAQSAAEYSYQLTIAKQQMGDISGLAGVNLGYGQTQIGVLERQNLLIGRQAQQLQFTLSQRQINYQQAMAGFVVPGMTPAQHNAAVEEAKVEANIAQKQLGYQKQMFGNQVKIVDLTNLRTAQNMARQIALTISGHRVQLMDQADMQRLSRLQAQQAITMNQISAQMSKVESSASVVLGQIAQKEQAAGEAIAGVSAKWVKAAYDIGKAWYDGATGSGLTSVPGGDTMGGTSSGRHAAGIVGMTTGTTHMIVGEAGAETVAVLRNPRSVSGSTGFGVGGASGDVVINLTATLDGAVIYRDVVRRQGRDAALRGLRGPN